MYSARQGSKSRRSSGGSVLVLLFSRTDPRPCRRRAYAADSWRRRYYGWWWFSTHAISNPCRRDNLPESRIQRNRKPVTASTEQQVNDFAVETRKTMLAPIELHFILNNLAQEIITIIIIVNTQIN